ncbi:uncharacterized protein LOC131187454 [Ahaetulla prasina]|uniref:uncharacterized protein LOC131187454 n=1 Tax=Ahaetulla prasina TaxID=499056 RepID=UPI002649C7BB|nr:uncharacterized protein LOC131187454 [Ahaetulla prasina]
MKIVITFPKPLLLVTSESRSEAIIPGKRPTSARSAPRASASSSRGGIQPAVAAATSFAATAHSGGCSPLASLAAGPSGTSAAGSSVVALSRPLRSRGCEAEAASSTPLRHVSVPFPACGVLLASASGPPLSAAVAPPAGYRPPPPNWISPSETRLFLGAPGLLQSKVPASKTMFNYKNISGSPQMYGLVSIAQCLTKKEGRKIWKRNNLIQFIEEKPQSRFPRYGKVRNQFQLLENAII